MNTKERDLLIGIFYILLFLLIAPAIFGGITNLLYWAKSENWIPLWVSYPIGLIVTALLFSPLVHKMYIINPAFRVSFHLDPFFGHSDSLSSNNENSQLIARGPGFHPIGFWEKFDSFTEHEKEITIKLSGKFETSGDDLNLEVEKGMMILKAPLESAKILRSVGKGMDVIKKEIEDQLGPALKQSTAMQFIKQNSEYIMAHQAEIAHLIREEFERYNQIVERYGLQTMKFVLGDVNFSDKINLARESAKAATLRGKAAKKVADDLGLDGKDATDFVLASDGIAKVTIDRNVYEIKGLSPEAVTAVTEIAGAIKEFKKK